MRRNHTSSASPVWSGEYLEADGTYTSVKVAQDHNETGDGVAVDVRTDDGVEMHMRMTLDMARAVAQGIVAVIT